MTAVRVLALGGTGAVGQQIVRELRRCGHEVTLVGRRPQAGGVVADVQTSTGLAALRRAAAPCDVVVNASGVENPAIATAVGPAVLLDISSSASYIASLTRQAPPGSGVVVGVGLVPGLSTLMIAALEPGPGAEVDLAIIFGGGEAHGTAGIDWTAGLAGRELYQPPENRPVRNFQERRRLSGPWGSGLHLRADFPDHWLIGRPGGFTVRSWLALDTALGTGMLALVGRIPRLNGLLRKAPRVGSRRWSLRATVRGTDRVSTAHGEGQSLATAMLTVRFAVAAATMRPLNPVKASDLLNLDALGPIPGVQISVG